MKKGSMIGIPYRKEETARVVAKFWINKIFIVYSDGWKVYKEALVSFNHKMVCHKKYFINPELGVYTQQTERFWFFSKDNHLHKRVFI